MDIEAIVINTARAWAYDKGTSWTDHMRAALTELSAAHAIELRAYEATVQNMAERIRQLEAALDGLVSIAHDSNGVAGYHLNGDIADWYSFPEFEDAVAALPAQPKKEDSRHD